MSTTIASNGIDIAGEGRGSASAAAVGRFLLAAIFLWSGYGKVTDPATALGYIQSVGLPAPGVALGVAAFIELVGGLALVVGYRTRLVAAVMALFCLATAAVFHSAFADPSQLINFFKNLAMTGGLLQVVAFGAGRISLDELRRARRV